MKTATAQRKKGATQMWRTFIDGSRPFAAYCVFKCLKGRRAAIPTDVTAP